ncbi:MAG: hypothetical protein U1F61_17315 [Opitutaceae bacterium]
MAHRRSRSRSRSSGLSRSLQLETLEQRQLLATILAGSGTEVASNIPLNGGIYDQILLTGNTITVAADPGEVVRVSFLDQGGDIVQAEFAGKGTMTLSLEDVKTAGTPGYLNKNPDQFLNGQKINYLQGLATITIDKPELNTNLGVYAAGILQNPGFFTGQAKQGDNGLADIGRVLLVGDPTAAAGYSLMGGIRMGGAVLSAPSGVAGIKGETVAVQTIVAIGDIDAKGTAVPTLTFNSNSQFQTVFLRGGDLRQTNGASFNNTSLTPPTLGGFNFITPTNGTSSANVLLWASPVSRGALAQTNFGAIGVAMEGDWAFDWSNPNAVKVTQNGTDVSASFGGDWLAKGGIQTSLDYAFDQRTFTGNLTLTGDLAANATLTLASASKNITFENSLRGNLVVSGAGATIGGTLTVKGDLDGTVLVRGFRSTGSALSPDQVQNRINALVVEGNTGASADVRAEDIGSVTIRKTFSGLLSTDVSRDNAWNGTLSPATVPVGSIQFVDYEGRIGDVTIGYAADGKSTGGSLLNGMIQGMSGIGNVKIGGDVAGTPPGTSTQRAVFATASNPGGASTDAVNFGFTTIGSIEVLGDVDLDSAVDRFLWINGHGTFGDITIQGKPTTGLVPGLPTGTTNVLLPGSEVALRVLSPFTDKTFVPDTANGQRLVTNYDPDGVAGSLDTRYRVTNNDVNAGAQVYDLVSGKLVAAKIGDLVPVLVGGAPVLDTTGAPVYTTNTALYQSAIRATPVLGPGVSGPVSGNRGTLDGQANAFGRIEITGTLGLANTTTGKISWTDSVDMDFGGITVGAPGKLPSGAISDLPQKLGQITLASSSGATSNLTLSGTIGSRQANADGFATVTMTGLDITGFEDVRFAAVSANPAANLGVWVTDPGKGITVTTVTGSGVGLNAVSPSIVFDSRIQIDTPLTQSPATSLLTLNAGTVNSLVSFSSGSGVIARGSGAGGAGGAVGPMQWSADTIAFDGTLQGAAFGTITLTGGKGASSSSGTAVRFEGSLALGSLAGVTAFASEGNVAFSPVAVTGPLGASSSARATFGTISLSTLSANNGGDITFGVSSQALAAYQADFGDITLTAGHRLTLNQGVITENPGNITLNLTTTGKIGNLNATTTTGTLTSALLVQGDAGNITFRAGAATTDKTETYGGLATDLVRAGSIVATQTIWGTRGTTRLETAGQTFDGAPAPLEFLTAGATSNKVLPDGTLSAKLNYAGKSIAAGDSFIARSGAGAITLAYTVLGIDSNADGKLSAAETGHGGSVSVSSISGDLAFVGGTQLADGTTVATLGNVSLKTGSYATASGLIGAAQKGDIRFSFNDLPEAPATGGFEGSIGNLSASTAGGDITWEASRLDGNVGTVTLQAGSVAHSGGVAVGNLLTPDVITFNGSVGRISAEVTDIGTLGINLSLNGPLGASGAGVALTSQYGSVNALLRAGGFDATGDGLLSAAEFGRMGDVTVTSAGGTQTVTLNAELFQSDAEQSRIGHVSLQNAAFVDIKAGATDIIGSGKSALGSTITGALGNSSLVGASAQYGAVGDVVISTTTGLVTQRGTFGEIGITTIKTGAHFDVDSNSATSNEPHLLLASGNIQLGTSGFQTVAKGQDVDPGTDNPFTPDVIENFLPNQPLEIRGKHGLVTLEVKEAGAISGSVYYGGAATGTDSLHATSERGNLSLAVWLEDLDRDRSGTLNSAEFGSLGATTLAATGGGDVTLVLGTDQNDAAIAKLGLVPEFKFGAVNATATDIYSATDAAAVDTLGSAGLGHVTITGAGADARNTGAPFGPVTANRGAVASITASVVRGQVTLNGQFGSLGDQSLTAGRYLDALSGGRTDVYVGSVAYSPSIWGSHGTATLRTDDSGVGGEGSRILNGDGVTGFDPLLSESNFATIIGTATFGGSLAVGRQVSIDARTGRTDIDLDLIARGYDLNGDGKLQGTEVSIPANEFAALGDILIETTRGGDIDLGLATASASSSPVGSRIGTVSLVANDDVISVLSGANDVIVDLATVRVTGLSTPNTGGEIGALTVALGAGNGTLTGTFGSLGALSLATGQIVDTSPAGGTPIELVAGNLFLGTGKSGDHANADVGTGTTLNLGRIAGVSTATVLGSGTITGEIFSFGTPGPDASWAFTSNLGQINLGLVAGFDIDNADGDNNTGTGAEIGGFGAVKVNSTAGAITLGLGARAAGSSFGAITARTGDAVTVNDAANDSLVSGTLAINFLAGTGPGQSGVGSIASLLGATKTGALSLAGRFGDIGTVDLSTDAYVDNDTAAGPSEAPVVIKAGDITVNASFWGAHGDIRLKTVDSSALPGTQAQVPGTVADLGNINATLAFSGDLVATSPTAGINASSDRGNLTLSITAGIDEDTGNDFDATDAGQVGAITAVSKDGDISLSLGLRNSGSSVSSITLATNSTWQSQTGAVDIEVATGDIEIIGINAGANAQSYGSVGPVNASTLGGGITMTGAFENLGKVTLLADRYTDPDTAPGLNDPPVVLSSGKGISVTVAVRGQHDTFKLTSLDDPTPGAVASHPAPINVDLALFGPLAVGSSHSLMASTQQGTITGQVRAGTYLPANDAIAGVFAPLGVTNQEFHIGKAGNIELTSRSNDIDFRLTTTAPVAPVGPTDPVFVPSIGNVVATTGSSYAPVSSGADTLISKGDIRLGNFSVGAIGSITAATTTGDIQLDGAASNLIGAITLTTAQYVDSDTLAVIAGGAGSILHSTHYQAQPAAAAVPGVSPATLPTGVTGGAITLTAGGSLSGANQAAGKITDSGDLTSLWIDDGDSVIEPGELYTVTFGSVRMSATDGEIAFLRQATGLLNSKSYGVKLHDVALLTTGTSKVAGSGNITLGGGGFFSEISSFEATPLEGDVIWSGNYEAPLVSGVTLHALDGDVTLSGALNLGLPNAINSRTANASLLGVTLWADNGAVALSGTIGEAIDYRSGLLALPAGSTSDTRTATLTGITLRATNGTANDLATDGVISVTGRIGGNDVTWIDQLVFTSPLESGDSTTLSTSANGVSNVEAWNIGTLQFSGATTLANVGIAPNIKADDSATTRALVGSVVYLNSTTFLPVASTPSTPGYGSVLNAIGSLTVNGSLSGSAAATLKTGSVGEIMASQMGNLQVTTVADPTATTLYSVSNLDLLIAPQNGELIAATSSAKALTTYQTLDAFSLGNVSIVQSLQGPSTGTALFSGSNAIVAGGKLGNLTLTAVPQGGVQAPLFLPGASASAWFVVGDINGKLGTANTEAAYGLKTTNGTTLVALPTAVIRTGDITVNVGSSYTPPAAQVPDIGNAGGAGGGGFAVAVGVDVNGAGNYLGAGVVTATRINSTGPRILTGSVGAVSIANDAIRPDNDSIGAAPTTVNSPGVIVVAGDGTATPEIADLVNELTPPSVRPMNEGDYYTVGDVDGSGDATVNDVVVYVI